MPTFQPRSALFGDQLPRNSNGSLRPLLSPLRPYLTVHYTGVWVNYADHNDSPIEIRNIQSFAISANKPWEYNYVFDTQGNVWEYAGLYRAAHSEDENGLSFGCLFLLGVNDAPSPAQIEAFRWFRWVLQAFRNLAPDHQVRPHKQMPGAATACPGQLILNRWGDLMTPWTVDPPPPPPPPSTYKWIEPNCRFTLQPGDSPYGVARIAYGNGARYTELVTANPGPWTVGRQVIVPGANGAGFKVRSGDYPIAILRDIWPNDNPYARLPTFLRWNGGDRVYQVGDVTYAPIDPMKG